MARPKYAQERDKNHLMVKEFCKGLGWKYAGLPLYLIDVSAQGGELLDWLLWLGPLCIAVEVKSPDNPRVRKTKTGMDRFEYKQGEIDFMDNCPGPWLVVSSMEELADGLAKYSTVATMFEWTVQDLKPCPPR